MQRPRVKLMLGLVGVFYALGSAPAGAISEPVSASRTPLSSVVQSPLTVSEIVEKNVAARGGLQAWRQVQTIAWSGQLRSGTTVPAMPFKMLLKRPNKSRFEVVNMDQQSARVFDGAHGWKQRPGRAGPDVRAFTTEEERFAQDEFVIDGLLIDHQAKGISVALEGINEIDGRKAYRLAVKLPSGSSRRLWVDAQTFLEVRCDRPSWSPTHRGAAVSTYYSDYRAVDGLQIPMMIESAPAVETAPETHAVRDKLIIERVVLNPLVTETAFAKPAAAHSRRAVVQVGAQSGANAGVAASTGR